MYLLCYFSHLVVDPSSPFHPLYYEVMQIPHYSTAIKCMFDVRLNYIIDDTQSKDEA